MDFKTWVEEVRRHAERAREHAARIRERTHALQAGVDTSGEAYNARLSPRERRVLRLLCAGLTSKQIAARLGVSRNTANYHVANIYRKLGTHSRVATANYFQRLLAGAAPPT